MMPLKDLEERKAYQKAWHEDNKARRRRKDYLRTYSCATPENFEHYLAATHCEVCGVLFQKGYRRCQDHCHTTGKIRKVICSACNTIEGQIRDFAHLKAITRYIEEIR